MHSPHEILAELGLTESEIDVYLAMRRGIIRVQDIVKVTGRKRPTIYYALDSLQKRGLISKTGQSGEAAVRVESTKRLVIIAEEQKKKSEVLLRELELYAAELAAHDGVVRERPSVSFFEGVDAIKGVIMETLYCMTKEICVVAPQDNFFIQVGHDFREKYVDVRGKRGIRTRSLWEKPTDMKTYARYYSGLSDIRILPLVMRGAFESTVFLYDDKTLYISSAKNSYCILVTSREHHATMKAWFEGLWSTSTVPLGKAKKRR